MSNFYVKSRNSAISLECTPSFSYKSVNGNGIKPNHPNGGQKTLQTGHDSANKRACNIYSSLLFLSRIEYLNIFVFHCRIFKRLVNSHIEKVQREFEKKRARGRRASDEARGCDKTTLVASNQHHGQV